MSAETPAIYDDLVREFVHNYPRGARLLAVASIDAERSRVFAARLAEALETQGTATRLVTAEGRNEAALRAEVVEPFRSERPDATIVISGDTALLTPEIRGLWHHTLWLVAGDERPYTAASAIVDVTDPAHPTRRFADFCAVPPSVKP
ncbi:hypothetical protein ACWIBQ_09755 [Microbacterium keratanolyticum]